MTATAVVILIIFEGTKEEQEKEDDMMMFSQPNKVSFLVNAVDKPLQTVLQIWTLYNCIAENNKYNEIST